MRGSGASVLSIRVLFFARYAELVGREAIDIQVHAPATVGDVLLHLREVLPEAGRLPSKPLCALNLAHALLDADIADGDELALLPPLAGG